MGLKLMVEKDDKILIGDDTIITISKLGRRPTLHINAPPDVKLIHIKSDLQTILKPKERSLRLLFYCQGGKHGHTQTQDAPTSTAPSAGSPSAQKSDYATTKDGA